MLGLRPGARRPAPPGLRLAHALERLGPAYIKLGQMLATRPDIVGEDVARALEHLQDRLPPFPDDVARAAIADSLGRPVDKLFSAFGAPVAAASIAQVHRATTTEGADAAVKVLRPGVEALFRRDLEALALFARMAERFSVEAQAPALRRTGGNSGGVRGPGTGSADGSGGGLRTL